MKATIIILFAMLTLSTVKAQQVTASRTLVYSEKDNALVFEDTLLTKYNNIVIKSLPDLGLDSVPVKIVLTPGRYTLAKSSELAIPFDYRVYVEDTWTEKNYNLNSSQMYSFKVGNDESERFVLRISQPVSRLAYRQ